MPNATKARADKNPPLWARWPLTSPPRPERVTPDERWFESVRACFPSYRPPREPDWEAVRRWLASRFTFDPKTYVDFDVSGIVGLLDRSQPPLAAEEFAPRLFEFLLEERTRGRCPLTRQEIIYTAGHHMMVLPMEGAAEEAVEILLRNGLLKPMHVGANKQMLVYVAVRPQPLPYAQESRLMGSLIPPQGPTAAQPASSTQVPAASEIKHSEDYRSVKWYGKSYTFTVGQAGCVKCLWEAWESGTPELSQETVLEAAGVSTQRLSDAFRGNVAWGKMIVKGSTKGSYRLQESTVAPT